MKLAFIGGGVMAEAFLKGLLGRGLAQPSDIAASDVDAPRRQWLAQKYGVATTQDNLQAAAGAEVVVLAIKPQNLSQVMADLGGKLGTGQLALSIVAGATLATLTRGLRHPTVVRAMPNTPGQIGQGITAWMATPAVSGEHREAARLLLSTLGREIYADKEDYLDIATALSGSGPAYLFLIMEALMDGAVHLGLPRAMAREMVLQTVAGSALLAQGSERHLAELRDQVTSPGGTTAEGLMQLEEGGLRAILARAVQAAYEKAKLLGGPEK